MSEHEDEYESTDFIIDATRILQDAAHLVRVQFIVSTDSETDPSPEIIAEHLLLPSELDATFTAGPKSTDRIMVGLANGKKLSVRLTRFIGIVTEAASWYDHEQYPNPEAN